MKRHPNSLKRVFLTLLSFPCSCSEVTLASPSTSRRLGGSPTPRSFLRNTHLPERREELPSPLRSPFAVPSARPPPTLLTLAAPNETDPCNDSVWLQMPFSPKNKVQSGRLYSALLLTWFASTLPKGLGFSSEWGLLQLKIQAGWRDEVDQSTGNIQEKWLCSSPRLGLILPPTDQKCSLLGMKPLTAERLQAPGKQPAPKALNTSGLGSALRLKVQRWRISKRFRNASGKRQSRGQDGWWQRTVCREKSQRRKVGLDGARLQSLNFSFNWNELRMVNLLRKY